ncbi:MAG: DUF523 and DUF1722 domain-containing protein [Spirochaetales bacterium]|nr:DUF523 and DUF1722 domain-containing protein [Spirochaetales bacterium]
MDKIRIGISSCLLGNSVRYDGGHKQDRFITDTLSAWCEFVPVCPEVECGLPVPRESMRLVGTKENHRLLTIKTRTDHTPRMTSWANKRLKELEKEDLVAFIFKTKSPSSGLRSIKVYSPGGNVVSVSASGMFAEAFTRHFPDIPVEDEGRLHDMALREKFIETIFVLQRWRDKVKRGKPKDLIEFHSRHKYTFMAHHPELLRGLGKIVASIGTADFADLKAAYMNDMLKLLATRKTVKKNYNTLLHINGYFKNNLERDETAELKEQAERYYQELVPLIVPLTLIRHYARKFKQEYLLSQYFLDPHPIELGLLNHV